MNIRTDNAAGMHSDDVRPSSERSDDTCTHSERSDDMYTHSERSDDTRPHNERSDDTCTHSERSDDTRPHSARSGGLRLAGEYAAAWGVGSALYSLLELSWRGFTHWTMSLTSGFCMAVLYFINSRFPKLPLWKKCLFGAAVITASEFCVGMAVNRRLSWRVWDYSKLPLNIAGQICPLFSALWFALCVPAFFICKLLCALMRGRPFGRG